MTGTQRLRKRLNPGSGATISLGTDLDTWAAPPPSAPSAHPLPCQTLAPARGVVVGTPLPARRATGIRRCSHAPDGDLFTCPCTAPIHHAGLSSSFPYQSFVRCNCGSAKVLTTYLNESGIDDAGKTSDLQESVYRRDKRTVECAKPVGRRLRKLSELASIRNILGRVSQTPRFAPNLGTDSDSTLESS